MKFGVREICDVVLKAKTTQKIGNKVFYKDEPVLYFDSLKTSSMEGAATTVYAQGGRGNSRLIAWEGERTVTFTMEDALISPAGFSILSGAGLINASKQEPLKTHKVEKVNAIEYSLPATGQSGGKFFRRAEHVVAFSDDGSHKIPASQASTDAPTPPDFNTIYFYRDRSINDNNNFSEVVGNPEQFYVQTTEGGVTYNTYYWHEKGEPNTADTKKTYYTHNWTVAQTITDPNWGPYYQLIIYISEKPYFELTTAGDRVQGNSVCIFRLNQDNLATEPFYPWYGNASYVEYMDDPNLLIQNDQEPNRYFPQAYKKYRLIITTKPGTLYSVSEEEFIKAFLKNTGTAQNPVYELADNLTVLVDYYVERDTGYKIDITPDKFGGNYYLEASTLFRAIDGRDLPARFTIPNCKIQSNFTFSMASSGDPSTFTFTMDALPDYTRFDNTKKVLAAIQILDPNNNNQLSKRTDTFSETDFMNIAAQALREKTWTDFEPSQE